MVVGIAAVTAPSLPSPAVRRDRVRRSVRPPGARSHGGSGARSREVQGPAFRVGHRDPRLPTRPRRSAHGCGLPGAALPCGAGLVPGRVHRRRPVLRAVGFPGLQRAHGRAPGLRVAADRTVLLPSGPTPAAGCRGGRGGHVPGVHAAVVGGPPGCDRRRRGQRPALLRQLPLHGGRERLLRRGRRQEPVPALLVAVDRGAVLRVLPRAAVPPVPRTTLAPGPRGHRRAGGHAGGVAGRPDRTSRRSTPTGPTTGPTPACTSSWPAHC